MSGSVAPPWTLAVKPRSVLSIDLIHDVGPAGTAWLRLGIGGLIFLAIARSPLRAIQAATCRYSWAGSRDRRTDDRLPRRDRADCVGHLRGP